MLLENLTWKQFSTDFPQHFQTVLHHDRGKKIPLQKFQKRSNYFISKVEDSKMKKK
jgi:hypothetical protein